MPGLPRIRRTRGPRPEVVQPVEPRRPAELSHNGLTWIHLESLDPDAARDLRERFDWHPLDLEDVLSKRRRPKMDEYEDYLFVVLHFPGSLDTGEPQARNVRPEVSGARAAARE